MQTQVETCNNTGTFSHLISVGPPCFYFPNTKSTSEVWVKEFEFKCLIFNQLSQMSFKNSFYWYQLSQTNLERKISLKIIKFHKIWENLYSENFCPFNPNLGGGRGVVLPCWFSLNNSETVKAVTLTFCSIQ